MIICYSGRSAPSAQRIADEDDDIFTSRNSHGDVNWGRASADTELNPDISNSTNKRIMRQLFRDNEVPTPPLYTPDEVRYALTGGFGDFIGRPDYHSRGRGLWRVRTERDLNRALRGTRRKMAATHFMEYMPHGHEYRVHVFNGKSIRISEKDFYDTHSYTTTKPTGEVKQVRKAAKKAVKALGLDFGAVDVLASNDGGVWVLEVNAAPGLGGTMPALYARTFKQWYNEREL